MKLENEFKSFLTDTVNLNQTRVDRAAGGIDTVEKFLKNNELFKDIFISVTP